MPSATASTIAAPFADVSRSLISLQIATLWSWLDLAALRRISDEGSNRSVRENGQDWHYRRAVTRRASKIFPPEPAFRKQDAANSGQTWVEQLEAAARTFSRSPLASAAASPVCTFGEKPGKAITEVPRSTNIARANSVLTILGC
jgi:hypothetical protein